MFISRVNANANTLKDYLCKKIEELEVKVMSFPSLETKQELLV